MWVKLLIRLGKIALAKLCLVTGPNGLEMNTYALSEEEDIVIIRPWAEFQAVTPDLSRTTDGAGKQERDCYEERVCG